MLVSTTCHSSSGISASFKVGHPFEQASSFQPPAWQQHINFIFFFWGAHCRVKYCIMNECSYVVKLFFVQRSVPLDSSFSEFSFLTPRCCFWTYFPRTPVPFSWIWPCKHGDLSTPLEMVLNLSYWVTKKERRDISSGVHVLSCKKETSGLLFN